MEAIIFTGIQAVGKSTFYKERFFTSHIRINLDMLRTRHREAVLLRACIEAKQPFVIDNTNVTAAGRAVYIEAARSAGFRVCGYYFQSNLKDALERNRQRHGSEAIPEKGILGTYSKLQIPMISEGFDQLFYVAIGEEDGFTVTEWSE